MIHLLRQPATDPQLQEMLEAHGEYMKVAVDVRRGVLAGGGEFHADCESVLLEDGSLKDDIWGADWVPGPRLVRCSALINIRPRINPAMDIHDSAIREQVERVTRKLLERS